MSALLKDKNTMGGFVTGRVICCLVFITICAVSCKGQIDNAFCQRELASLKRTSSLNLPLPKLAKSYRLNLESLRSANKYVQNAYEAYSTTAQSVRAHVVTAKTIKDIFLLAPRNTYLESERQIGGNFMCIADPLQASDIAKGFNVKSVNGKLTLEKPKTPLVIGTLQPETYIGKTKIRDINVDTWHVCGYRPWDAITVSAVLYYSSDDVVLPNHNIAVPIASQLKKKSPKTGLIQTTRNDYYNFLRDPALEDSNFEIPSEQWCTDGVDAMMPIINHVFSVQSDFLDLHDLNLLDGSQPPYVKYIKQVYNGLANQISVHNLFTYNNQAVNRQTVQDFTVGAQYIMDPHTGTCTQSIIKDDPENWKQDNFGNVRMTTPQEFFKLDRSYQYMGEHRNFDRGFPVDVYTSVTKTKDAHNNQVVNTLTWYFMSRNYMRLMGFKDIAVPVRLMDSTNLPGDTKLIDFYQYSVNPTPHDLYADLSKCFVKSSMYIDVMIDARYDFIYLSNPDRFFGDFTDALLSKTPLMDLTRLANIRVDRAENDKTMVRFTLLPRETNGNVDEPLPQPTNDAFYKSLKDVVDAGKFYIIVKSDLGVYKSWATGIRQHNLDPTSFEGLYGPAPTGYKPGDMAGLGMGMLIVGAILGVALFFGFLKFKAAPGDFNMQILKGPDSSA